MISRKVVVVLVNYNSPDDTLLCLRSLQESGADLYVVIVDNGSALSGKINISEAKSVLSDVHVIDSSVNLGFGGGNNIGILWALSNVSFKYIYILNNDTISTQTSIGIMLDYMDGQYGIGACSPRIMLSDDPQCVWYGGGDINWNKGGPRSWNFNKRFDGNISVQSVSFISGCAMLIPKDVICKVKGFDERFFMYCEDADLSARILSSGYTLAYLPEAVVYHKAHSTLRMKGSEYFRSDSVLNPRLAFFVENVVYGSLLNVWLHGRSIEKLFGSLWVLAFWCRRGIKYFLSGRIDAVNAIAIGVVRCFHQIRAGSQ